MSRTVQTTESDAKDK